MAILRGFSAEADKIVEICRNRRVRKLELFGSATSEKFDPSTSDLDFLVEFEAMATGYANAYFGLQQDLERLFHRPVDLITTRSIKNPYFLASIEPQRINLYEART